MEVAITELSHSFNVASFEMVSWKERRLLGFVGFDCEPEKGNQLAGRKKEHEKEQEKLSRVQSGSGLWMSLGISKPHGSPLGNQKDKQLK